MKLKANKQTMMLLGGALGLSLLASGGVFWLQQGALASTLETLQAREKELEDGKRIAERRELAQALLEEDLTQLRFLETGVSEAAYVPTFLKQLEELARSTQNQVLGIRPQVVTKAPTKLQQRRDPEAQEQASKDGSPAKDGEKKEADEPYTLLSIEVNLEGTYRSAQTFISRLTRFPKILAVEQVQLQPRASVSSDKAQPTPGQLSIQVKLTAFVMKESAPVRSSVTARAEVGGNQ